MSEHITGPDGATSWWYVGRIDDPDEQDRARSIVADGVRRWRTEAGLVPVPPRRNPRRFLCGCSDPPIGPSVVRADGTCCACSP